MRTKFDSELLIRTVFICEREYTSPISLCPLKWLTENILVDEELSTKSLGNLCNERAVRFFNKLYGIQCFLIASASPRLEDFFMYHILVRRLAIS